MAHLTMNWSVPFSLSIHLSLSFQGLCITTWSWTHSVAEGDLELLVILNAEIRGPHHCVQLCAAGMNSRAFCLLGRHSTNRATSHPYPLVCISFIFYFMTHFLWNGIFSLSVSPMKLKNLQFVWICSNYFILLRKRILIRRLWSAISCTALNLTSQSSWDSSEVACWRFPPTSSLCWISWSLDPLSFTPMGRTQQQLIEKR